MSSRVERGGAAALLLGLVLLGLWLAGVLVTSTLLPLLDHGYAALRHQLPYEIDLIRGLRRAYAETRRAVRHRFSRPGFRARMNAPITRPPTSRARTSLSRPAPARNALASSNR